MFTVLSCIRDQHDWRLVLVAAAICLVGCWSSLLLLQRVEEGERRHRRQWLVAAGATGGVAIWTTHFVAMLAYDGGLPMRYGPVMTTVSGMIAIVGVGLAYSIFLMGRNLLTAAGGGVLFGLGVAAMHFSGMFAIEAPARLHFDPVMTASAIAMGSFFGALGFMAFQRFRGFSRFSSGIALLVLAICSLHFTSMGAVTLIPDPSIATPVVLIERVYLAGIIIAVTTALIFMAIGAAFLDKHMTDLRGLANASLEGLIIVRDGRIVEINGRFSEISSWTLDQVAGLTPESILNLGPEGLACCGDTDDSVEITLHHATGGLVPVELLCRTIEYQGRESHVLVLRDLTERKEAERRIEHLAHHDALTDLPNRALFDQRMAQALDIAIAQDEQIALLYLDLDRFKAVNDIFGHAEGDRILCKVADLLRASTRTVDTVARLGGDEFAIILTGTDQPDAAARVADRILESFSSEMDRTRDPTAVGVSVGIAIYPVDASSIDELRAHADSALYRAKRSGRGNACFFDADMDEAARFRRELGYDLRQAIHRGQLSVAYQPLIDAKSNSIIGYEALARWNHPDQGEIDPLVFIPIAEENGAIIELGEWVLEQACTEAIRWDQPLAIAVNVSAVQFQLPNFCEQIAAILARTGLDGKRLELEITESVLMHDRDTILALLNRLRQLGVRIVMDDFGTGYSSLSNLQHFPFDKIKIDASFIGALEHDPKAKSIIRTIIGLGHSLDLPVVTEGIETEEQRRLVTEQGCAQLQGFLFGHADAPPSLMRNKVESGMSV